jgi:uncharacterized protein YukE
MEQAKGITPAEEIKVATEEIVAEAKEEAIEAPSRLRAKLRELEAMWERTTTQFFQAPKL